MRFAVPAISLLAAVPTAQTVTSPPGYATVEGFRDNRDLFPQTSLAARGYAHVDDEIRGMPPATITAMAWRRGGMTASLPLMGLRFVDVELVVGEAAWSRVRFDAQVSFPSLYRSPPTVACTLKPTLFPDWIQAPPVPFDLRLPLDVPAAYSGTDALMYELRSRQPSAVEPGSIVVFPGVGIFDPGSAAVTELTLR